MPLRSRRRARHRLTGAPKSPLPRAAAQTSLHRAKVALLNTCSLKLEPERELAGELLLLLEEVLAAATRSSRCRRACDLEKDPVCSTTERDSSGGALFMHARTTPAEAQEGDSRSLTSQIVQSDKSRAERETQGGGQVGISGRTMPFKMAADRLSTSVVVKSSSKGHRSAPAPEATSSNHLPSPSGRRALVNPAFHPTTCASIFSPAFSDQTTRTFLDVCGESC